MAGLKFSACSCPRAECLKMCSHFALGSLRHPGTQRQMLQQSELEGLSLAHFLLLRNRQGVDRNST